jgi:hypothetical protein
MTSSYNITPEFTNYTFHDHEWWLAYGGSHVWSDIIGVFIMPPIVAVGIFVNLAGFLVLQFSSEFKQAKIYTYLKFTLLNGFVCNATGMLYSFTVVRRYLPFANTYFALWYMNSIGLPIANVCYYYNLILDILITFEKLSIFVKRLEILNKKYLTRPQIICMVVFIVALLIDLPYFFFYTPSEQLVYFSPNETYLFVNYEISDFTQSQLGQITLYIQYVFRDILPLLCLIGLNVVLIRQLEMYMKKKRKMTSVGVIEGNATAIAVLFTTFNPSLDKTPSLHKISSQKNKQMQKTQVSTSIMVILICVLSFIKSSVILISIVYSSVQQGIIANLLGTFSDYLIYTITTLNFFIVMLFDRNVNQLLLKQSIFHLMCFKNLVGLRHGTSGSLAAAGGVNSQ